MRSDRARRAGLAVALVAAACVGCASADDGPLSPAELAVVNRDRHVDPAFPRHPVVVGDVTGLETSRLLFDTSVSAIVAENDPAAKLRAASLAVFAHSPMLVYERHRHADIITELRRLGALRIVLVGEVGIAESSGTPTVFRDPGGLDALGDMTAFRFTERVIDDPQEAVTALIDLDGREPILLRTSWDEVSTDPNSRVRPLPVQTRRDGLNSPVAIATVDTPLASIANARAYGAKVRLVDGVDPRASWTTFEATVGLSDQPLLALGRDFGTDEHLAAAIAEAEAAVGVRR
ncbi:hypothetical protein [Corynebacterium uterequi]|uniref:Uncharacterized protein n=1 Tax=Corynebacterium uterequi TaxID=1072256 RepID=A0A0G3HG71_9CORY|nr:hypothetical protein [Corynebacterium uterequi]AKK10953.1 hypothetical protein CUTER_04740 [Corynebacterium uterequi]